MDDMAEIRGGALGRNEGRGPKAATSSHARCSPKRAQPGEALQPRAAASLPELVPRQRAAPAAARPSSPNFRNPKPLRARVPPLAWALPLPSSARARAPQSRAIRVSPQPGHREAGRGVPEAHRGLAEVGLGAGALQLRRRGREAASSRKKRFLFLLFLIL